MEPPADWVQRPKPEPEDAEPPIGMIDMGPRSTALFGPAPPHIQMMAASLASGYLHTDSTLKYWKAHGLKGGGNRCYANSLLQALASSNVVVSWLVYNFCRYKSYPALYMSFAEGNGKTLQPSYGNVSTNLHECSFITRMMNTLFLVKGMGGKHDKEPFDCSDLLDGLGQETTWSHNRQQWDAHEVLNVWISRLFEEFSFACKARHAAEVHHQWLLDNCPTLVPGSEDFVGALLSRLSSTEHVISFPEEKEIVRQFPFYWSSETTITCSDCEYTSTMGQPNNGPIILHPVQDPARGSTNLESIGDYLGKEFDTPESVKYCCPVCNINVIAKAFSTLANHEDYQDQADNGLVPDSSLIASILKRLLRLEAAEEYGSAKNLAQEISEELLTSFRDVHYLLKPVFQALKFKEPGTAQKTYRILVPPQVLVIHLERTLQASSTSKDSLPVSFPQELDIKNCMPKDDLYQRLPHQLHMYNWKASIYHSGGTNSGHYQATRPIERRIKETALAPSLESFPESRFLAWLFDQTFYEDENRCKSFGSYPDQDLHEQWGLYRSCPDDDRFLKAFKSGPVDSNRASAHSRMDQPKEERVIWVLNDEKVVQSRFSLTKLETNDVTTLVYEQQIRPMA